MIGQTLDATDKELSILGINDLVGCSDMATVSKTRGENEESRALVEFAFGLARKLAISKLLVQADELVDVRIVERLREKEAIIWLARKTKIVEKARRGHDIVIEIPETGLTRMSQLNIGLFRAFLGKRISADERVVCLSGVAESNRLDTLVIANPSRDFPWYRKQDMERIGSAVASRDFGRVLDIALRFATEGREGKPIGTAFVLGDPDDLAPYLRQLILNPCEGHPKKSRSVHNIAFLETLRELSALDGAFVINTRGIVESAGTYLSAPAGRAKIESGLGARHAAAASITLRTKSVAVVVSESSGTVTVFHDGQAILELEKPKPVARRKT